MRAASAREPTHRGVSTRRSRSPLKKPPRKADAGAIACPTGASMMCGALHQFRSPLTVFRKPDHPRGRLSRSARIAGASGAQRERIVGRSPRRPQQWDSLSFSATSRSVPSTALTFGSTVAPPVFCSGGGISRLRASQPCVVWRVPRLVAAVPAAVPGVFRASSGDSVSIDLLLLPRRIL